MTGERKISNKHSSFCNTEEENHKSITSSCRKCTQLPFGSGLFPVPPLTLCHVNQTASQQGHTVGWLVVVQILKSPASDVRLFIHQARGVADHLEETLLLASVQVLVHEVVSGGKADQRVGQWNFVPGSVFDQPADNAAIHHRCGDYRSPDNAPHGIRGC